MNCIRECSIDKALAEINMFPFSFIIPQNSNDYNLSNSIFVKNSSGDAYARLDRLIEKCTNKCSLADCQSIVAVVNAYDISETDWTMVRVDLPVGPVIEIVYQSMLDFPSFLTTLLSCFGTWLGVSIFDMHQISKLRFLTRNDQTTNEIHELERVQRRLRELEMKFVLQQTALMKQFSMYKEAIDRLTSIS